MDVYFDHALGEWVGEYTYHDPDFPWETRRDTEWFTNECDAVAFARGWRY